MRQNIKTKEELKIYLEKKGLELNSLIEELTANKSDSNATSSLSLKIVQIAINYFNAAFSFGESQEVLESIYELMLMPIGLVKRLEYKNLLDILSIAVLLDKNPMDKIQNLLKEHSDDFLGLFTEAFTKVPSFGIDKILEYPYSILYLNIALTQSKEESLDILKDYLTKDFKPENDICIWALEAMALAKIYNVETYDLEQLDYFDTI